jgi:4-hydroxyphenylpyruvate dioxygenase
MSKVMSNGNGRIKFPINEPAEGKKITNWGIPRLLWRTWIQHIAIATDDIIKTVSQLKARGIEFLSAPPHTYYEAIPERLGAHMEWWKKILTKLKTSHHGRCWWGRYLLQILPSQYRPTLFFEIIQRMELVLQETLKHFFESIERTAIARNVIKKALFYIIKNNQ